DGGGNLEIITSTLLFSPDSGSRTVVCVRPGLIQEMKGLMILSVDLEGKCLNDFPVSCTTILSTAGIAIRLNSMQDL
ncbi:hypothetical protein P7K49_021051, partial [Saguinus oedipus]